MPDFKESFFIVFGFAPGGLKPQAVPGVAERILGFIPDLIGGLGEFDRFFPIFGMGIAHDEGNQLRDVLLREVLVDLERPVRHLHHPLPFAELGVKLRFFKVIAPGMGGLGSKNVRRGQRSGIALRQDQIQARKRRRLPDIQRLDRQKPVDFGVHHFQAARRIVEQHNSLRSGTLELGGAVGHADRNLRFERRNGLSQARLDIEQQGFHLAGGVPGSVNPVERRGERVVAVIPEGDF